ncbi:MAG: substrate-binding domain-containing protein [Magnetococcales bacterium]|nr:substrate-binding domain-containing protein [Magnetococcales bacterium]
MKAGSREHQTHIQNRDAAWMARPVDYRTWGQDSDLVVTLNQWQHNALSPAIKQFAKLRNYRVTIRNGRCGNSKRLLQDKAVDMGGFCCPPSFGDRLPGLTFHTIGIIPLAILLHESNPHDNLTLKQVRAIFQGKINDWSKLSGSNLQSAKPLPIRILARLHCKLRPGHWRLLLDNTDQFGANAHMVGTVPDMILKGVAGFTGSIGFETLSTLKYYQQKHKNLPVKAARIDGLAPSDLKHLLSGAYPLYEVSNLAIWEPPHVANGKAMELIHHLANLTEHHPQRVNSRQVIPASDLRRAGWRFFGPELVGAPLAPAEAP